MFLRYRQCLVHLLYYQILHSQNNPSGITSLASQSTSVTSSQSQSTSRAAVTNWRNPEIPSLLNTTPDKKYVSVVSS